MSVEEDKQWVRAEPDMKALKHRALLLVWIGELWNGVEAGVGLWSGVSAGSVALLAFAFDSFIEVFAGFVLILRLGREWSHAETEKVAEIRARKLVGITFFLLSGYIVVHSSATLLGWVSRPEVSPIGIVIVVSSAVFMTFLYWRKTRLSTRIGSRALRAEAIESLVCDVQDLTILGGLGLNALAGWWWADPLGALFLLPLLVKEGWEALFSNEAD